MVSDYDSAVKPSWLMIRYEEEWHGGRLPGVRRRKQVFS